MSAVVEPSYTIQQFCVAEGITTPTYFKLRKQGRGPREMRLGCAIRISHRARLEWQKQQENLKGEAAEAQRRKDDGLLGRAHAAHTRSVASSEHVSRRRTGR